VPCKVCIGTAADGHVPRESARAGIEPACTRKGREGTPVVSPRIGISLDYPIAPPASGVCPHSTHNVEIPASAASTCVIPLHQQPARLALKLDPQAHRLRGPQWRTAQATLMTSHRASVVGRLHSLRCSGQWMAWQKREQ